MTRYTNYVIFAGVRLLRLDLFGSAASGGYDPARSDLDLLVQFESMPPVEHAENHLAFLESLESLFARRVDLVNADSIRNPYFRESVERTRRQLYAA